MGEEPNHRGQFEVKALVVALERVARLAIYKAHVYR